MGEGIEPVFRSGGRGGAEREPVFALGGGKAGGAMIMPVRALGGGTGGRPTRRLVRALGGGMVGTDEVETRGAGGWGIGTTAEGVTETDPGWGGRSTRRSEPVGRLTCTGTGAPSGVVGRPGEASTPLCVGGTGSVSLLAGEAPAGARGMGTGPEEKAGCGASGSGIRGIGGREETLASTGATGMTGGMGGGVANVGGLPRWAGTGGGTGKAGGFGDSEAGMEGMTGGSVGGRVTEEARAAAGSVWVAGRAGGLDWWEIGARGSASSTLPLWTKTLAFGLAMTTRGGEPAILPEGVEAGSSDSVGRDSSGAEVPPLTPRALPPSGVRWGKRGVVLAEEGAPVMGGAALRPCVWLGGRVVGAGVDRIMLGIGLVTAVDQEGGICCAGTGLRLVGGRIEAGFIGRVVAAEIFGRGATGVAAGLSGRGGRLMRRVSRFGGFNSGFSASGGMPSSAIVVFL
jgi:hypothetical protein